MNLDESRDLQLRRHRPFALYWLSRVFSTVALQMQAVAVGWQIYELTNNPLDLGLVGLCYFIPAFLLVLVAGHVADRYDRRTIVRLCQFASGAGIAVLAVGTSAGWLTRETILGIILLIGAARTFESTTMQTLVPALVPIAVLPRAQAAASSATQTAVIAGPAIGGLIYAVSPVLVYSLCCALYIVAGILVGLIRMQRAPYKREPMSVETLFAGFAFIRRNPIVLGAISLDMFAVLLGGATALLPVFARDVLETDAWGLGLLRAAPGVGALLTAAILVRWPPKRNAGRIMFAGVAIFGVSVIVFALSRSMVLSLIALTVLGGADMLSVVIRMTLIQLETPDAMRGRVGAVNSLFVTASNQLGEFRAGAMAAFVGTIPAVIVGGFGALLVVAIGRKAFPELYRVQAMDAARR
jgi:MFS family permease